MNVEHLVAMANQISQFFEGQTPTENAAISVADHLRRFWDPRMRTELIAYVDAGGSGLREVAHAAAVRLSLAPAAAPAPVRTAMAAMPAPGDNGAN